MMLFEFLKKLFGWVDEGSRKKRRADTFSIEKEFVTPKKHKSDYKTAQSKEELIELDDSDSDDIQIMTERKYSPISSCARLNGSHNGRDRSYSYCTAPSYSSKSSYPKVNHNRESISYYANKNHKISNNCTDYKCHTLTKTHQLKEKSQYEELLQNYVSCRINGLSGRQEERQQEPQIITEVIDLEKSDASFSSSYKTPQSDKTSETISQTRWFTPHRTRKDKIISLVQNRKDDSIHSPSKKIEVFTVETSTPNNSHSSLQTMPIECVATNTLRDKLAAKAVIRGDFIPQVAKRYNERIEQRHKEAEELKKMTCVLSKHNRLAREAALEEQLARSMRLCEAVLDEREEPEEAPLPTLIEEILQEIKSALVPRPPDEVLVEGFGLRITRKDIHTLADLNWLNDEVINFYMNLLIARGTGEKFPKVHAMNTFFYPKLLSGGHASLKRWTRKIDIFAQDLIVVPVHLDIHWCMAIIDFRDKSIRYYDSMGSSNQRCLSALKQYLQDESLDKKKKPFDTSDWKLESVKNIPQQMNGSDCGVFSCMFAEYICANRKITFSQQDMPYFRNKMVYEILKSKLL